MYKVDNNMIKMIGFTRNFHTGIQTTLVKKIISFVILYQFSCGKVQIPHHKFGQKTAQYFSLGLLGFSILS